MIRLKNQSKVRYRTFKLRFGPYAASVIGAGGGVVAVAFTRYLEFLRIDDVAGAFAVHGAAGVFGTVAIAVAAEPLCGDAGPQGFLAAGAEALDLLVAQLVGVLAIGVFAAVTSYCTCVVLEVC